MPKFSQRGKGAFWNESDGDENTVFCFGCDVLGVACKFNGKQPSICGGSFYCEDSGSGMGLWLSFFMKCYTC